MKTAHAQFCQDIKLRKRSFTCVWPQICGKAVLGARAVNFFQAMLHEKLETLGRGHGRVAALHRFLVEKGVDVHSTTLMRWLDGSSATLEDVEKVVSILGGDMSRCKPDYGMAAEAEKWAQTRIKKLEAENAELREALAAVRAVVAPPEPTANATPTGAGLEALAEGKPFRTTKVVGAPKPAEVAEAPAEYQPRGKKKRGTTA